MKNIKIIFTTILFLLLIIIGTLNVNATQEINSTEEIINAFGKENIEINQNEIKLLNDINLKDNLLIRNGNYTLNLNGKTISYIKNNDIAFYVYGGNLKIEDETNNGKLISNGTTIFCNKGLVTIENCKIDSKVYGISIDIATDGIVQINNGEFFGAVNIAAGNLIINGGVFKAGLDVSFEEFSDKLPNVIINDGEFIGNHAGLYIWFSHYAQNVQLKGGTFKGYDKETPGIYVGGDKFALKELLPFGYKFDNNKQNVEEVQYGDYTSYHTTSANQVSVRSWLSRNIIKLIFVDYDGNIITTKNMIQGGEITLPQAPEKENYVFVDWNINLEGINHDTVVTPIYEKIYNLKIDTIYDAYYTGEEIKPNIVVIDETTKNRLSEGKDYEIICENNKNVGTAKILVQGKGKYKYSSKLTEFKILPKNINYEYKLNFEKEYEYTGNEIKPIVELIYKDTELINGVDYKVYYDSNIDVGYGRITIEGIGNYSGEKSEIFEIKPKQISEVILKATNVIYTGNKIMPEITVRAENKELSENIDYAIYCYNNVNIGTATVIIEGKGNYTGKIVKEFNIVSKSIKDIDIRIDLDNKCYTGKYIKPNVTLIDNDYKLKENSDYIVEYSNNLKIGKATIKITGKNGYYGTITETFNIIPKSVKIKSLKTSILRIVKLSWEKDSSIDGYEIYKSNTKEGKYSLVKTINKNSKNDCTFFAHKKGTYYYTIRTYKIINGNKIYSDFSDTKMIIVK